MSTSLTIASEILNNSTRTDSPAEVRVQYGNFDLPGKHLPIFDRHDESVQIGPSVAGARGSGYCI